MSLSLSVYVYVCVCVCVCVLCWQREDDRTSRTRPGRCQMSVASRGSRGSRGGTYRKVAHSSEVDETLFGEVRLPPRCLPVDPQPILTPRACAVLAASVFLQRHSVMARKASRGDTMSRKKILALTGRQSLATGASAPVVVASSELHRMKAAAVIKTADDLKRDAQLARAAQDARAAKARARKEHILRLEEKRKKAVPLTTLQTEKKAEDETVLQRGACWTGAGCVLRCCSLCLFAVVFNSPFLVLLAQPASMLRAEALDDVKALNSYGEYAKTVTIRNKQLAEKKEREAREKEAERIRDLEMEIQRLEVRRCVSQLNARACLCVCVPVCRVVRLTGACLSPAFRPRHHVQMVKMYHDREKEQRDALVEARKHIEVQMAERDAMRKAEQDRLRAEAARAKEEAVRVKEQEAKEFQESVERKAKQRAEVLKANEAAISAKHAAKEREIEEDRKIADYLKAEDARKACVC